MFPPILEQSYRSKERGGETVKKHFIDPTAEVVSFLSQDALMSYYDDGDIGGLVPGESGAGSGSGWGDF